MARSALVFAVTLLATHSVFASEINTGDVLMTTTVNGTSVTLDVTINDDGGVPGCTWFFITRTRHFADGCNPPGGKSVVSTFPRSVGNTISFELTDTGLDPNSVYFYQLEASPIPIPILDPSCDPTAFHLAFGSSWGLPIDVPAHTGPGEAALGRGTLGFDESSLVYYLELCCSPQNRLYFDSMPAGYEQFIGSEVMVYGVRGGWSVQFGWGFYATYVERSDCIPLPTRSVTWGQVKSMYR